MEIEKLGELHRYYMELVRLLFKTEEYASIDEINLKTYSIMYNLLFQSICSEVGVILQEVAKSEASSETHGNINDYKKVIVDKYPNIQRLRVKYNALKDPFVPWKEWEVGSNPIWWRDYNNVKHHRVEIDGRNGLPNYKLANQENVLNALAGLYVLEWCYLCEYQFTDDEKMQSMEFYGDKDIESSVKKAKSRIAVSLCIPQMSIMDFKGLRTFFAGYHSFDYDKLCDILQKR